jgi:protein transport protein SEC20
MSKLRRELGELEAIAEEQARPADRIASIEALAERRESHDSIRQILRDATLRAAEADALRATPTANDERDELLGDAPGAGGVGSKPDKPTDEAGVMGLADDATAGLRRARAMMAEELDKGRRTLAAMAESRATMKKTGDEYAGDQASALGIGGRLLKQLEIQAVRERVVLWGGFACFMLAALHVVLKRTPLLVRFHPLWWIRKKAAVKAVEAKKAAKLAAKDDETAAALAAAAAASLAAAAMGDDATAAGVVDAGAAEEYLAGDSADDGVPDVEVGEYMKTEL